MNSNTAIFKEFYDDININFNETTEDNENTDDEITNITSSLTSQLIQEVEKRRPLWDHRLPKAERYPNTLNKLWGEIVKELNCKYLFNIVCLLVKTY